MHYDPELFIVDIFCKKNISKLKFFIFIFGKS